VTDMESLFKETEDSFSSIKNVVELGVELTFRKACNKDQLRSNTESEMTPTNY
jgi:hypothetical protein